MRKRRVKVVDHRLGTLIFRILRKHRLVALAHASAHLPLAHGAAQVFNRVRKVLANVAQDALEVFRAAPEPRRAEQEHALSFKRLKKRGHHGGAIALIGPKACKHHVGSTGLVFTHRGDIRDTGHLASSAAQLALQMLRHHAGISARATHRNKAPHVCSRLRSYNLILCTHYGATYDERVAM